MRLDFSSKGLPATMAFDVIHTNLLAFSLQLMPVLLWCNQRLKEYVLIAMCCNTTQYVNLSLCKIRKSKKYTF